MRRSIPTALLAVALLSAACADGPASPDRASPATTSTAVAATTTARPAPEVAYPLQPEGVEWPARRWARSAMPDGVDRGAIDAAADTAFAGGAADRVRAVVIVHGGAIVYERYSPNPEDGPDVVMPSYSVAKSITAAAIGILVRDGRLDLDEPAPVPEWHEDPSDPRAGITVRQMLAMRTGIPWEDGFADAGTEMNTMLQRDDMAAYAASIESTGAPGSRFEYNTGTTMLLARIVGDVVGGGPRGVRRFLRDELFGPLGMAPVVTEFDRAGNWQGGFSADTTAEDFARFGLLHLRGGEWDGERLLRRDWVDLVRTPSDLDAEYAHHWWFDPRRPGVSYAVGIRGQVVTVDPAHDLVIVQLSTVGGQLPLDQTEAILDAFSAAG